jgi:predicted ATPase
VASYRSDEYPLLADELPKMNLIELGRLSDAEVAELSVSMLGDVGADPQVLDLLTKETEGNALFVIETVRVLAEEAGRLSRIGQVQLPDHVFSGGMQEIARRRLVRLSDTHMPLLRLAAVSGREIDLNLLQTFTTPLELDEWLLACELGIILEIQNGQWRFVHEKLREALFTDLPADHRASLHRQIAEGIETVYPDDPSYAAILADHWRMAGDAKRAARYARRAGQ